MWLWISGLARDEYNDWIELVYFSFVSQHQIRFVVRPGKFRAAIMRRVVWGESGEVVMFIDPHTEYHFADSVIFFARTNGDDDDALDMTINFTKSFRRVGAS